MSCLCKECLHRVAGRCERRAMEINEKFIKAWGCDNYECRYIELFKEDIKSYGRKRKTENNL